MADIRRARDLEKWLNNRPEATRRVDAVAIAGRAALRVLPLLFRGIGGAGEITENVFRDRLVFGSFRAMAVARKYSLGSTNVEKAARTSKSALQIEAPRATINVVDAVSRAVTAIYSDHVSFSVASVDAAYTAAAYAAADDAAFAIWRSILADTFLIENEHVDLHEEVLSAKLWLEVSNAGRGGTGGIIMSTPERVEKYWRDLCAHLLGTNDDWDVWTEWYESLLHDPRTCWGLPRERADAIMAEALQWDEAEWKLGPKHVNRRIRELIEAEPMPPREPLPASTAGVARFAIHDWQINVAPPEAWHGSESAAAGYHRKACELARRLVEQTSNTNAVPDVAGAASALVAVLGSDVAQVQPDLLRLATGSIAARARAYGHPQAQWEIGPEVVSGLFDLAQVLTDLQTFVKTEVAANEAEIRRLDLSPEQAAEAKESLDDFAHAILDLPEVFSGDAMTVFSAAMLVSDTAVDPTVKVRTESERLLVMESLGGALAREVGGGGSRGGGRDVTTGPPQPEPEPERSKRPTRRGTKKALTWDEFVERYKSRLAKSLPESAAAATERAIVKTIEQSPKTILGVTATFAAWVYAGGVGVLSSGIGLAAAWASYHVWRKLAGAPTGGAAEPKDRNAGPKARKPRGEKSK